MIHNPIRKALPDLSNPGAAGDLRSGKQLVGADGTIVTGTLAEVQQATPSISVSSGGLITATTTQSSGIVASGSKSATQQLTTQAAKTVTPTTAEQIAVASGTYTTGDVKVAGDANLVAENIAEGISIFGVTGTHSGLPETVKITLSSHGKLIVVNDSFEVESITYSGYSVNCFKNSIILFEGAAYVYVKPESAANFIFGYDLGAQTLYVYQVLGDCTIS